ncbi:hypothetical protein PEP31012_03714 [Pandoraea eparura]|uniref:Uncharacterized protein n=1 Tax=Pandoraea eparura TaxID=2508291 RepID=A0A5E4X5Z6_9BURK|nr:glycosyl hydrolase family 28-related protein [Pandoraea eparura]VVE31754.1 hypothetical protein PEP31012_03714 [Pandoraea eparura]
MQLLPNGKIQFIDANGAPLANGTVGYYVPATLTPKTTYQDQAGTIPNANPITLDSRGQALVWGSGTYRQIVKDSSGVTIWDQAVAASVNEDDLLNATDPTKGASLVGFDGGTLAQFFASKNNRVVDSIQALRGLSKATYTRAFVTGYYSTGDGGGGAYWCDSSDTTSADNGGTIIVAADGGRWKLVNQNVISVRQFGAKGDNLTDDSTAFTNFAAISARQKYIPTGNYIVNSAITFQAGDTVYGDGDGSVIIAGGSFPGGATYMFNVTGTLTALGQSMSVNANLGDTQLTFASAPSVSPNDTLIIYNPTNSSFSAWRTNYRQGEFCKVLSVTGSVVSIMANLWDSYVAAAVTVYKLVGARTAFRDLAFQQPNTMSAAIKISLIDHPIVENIKTGGSLYCGIYLDRCMDIDVKGRAYQSSALSGYQYGLLISNCQGGIVQGEFYGARHGIAPGGDDIVGGVPTRAIRFIADTNNSAAIGSVDPHGNSEGLIFQGCRFTNGFMLSGANHKFSNCYFFGNLNVGTALYAAELVRGTFDFDNCTFASSNNPNTTGNGNRGILDFSLQSNTQNSCIFNFNNCNFLAPAGTVYVNRYSVDGANVAFTINYTNARIVAGPAVTQFATLQRTSGSGSIASFTLSDVSGLQNGNAAFYAVTDGIIPVSIWRLPTQTFSGSIPVTSGANQNSVVINFPYKYPIPPNVILTALNSSAGGAKAIVNVNTTTSSSVTANCSSTSGSINFSSNDTMNVNCCAQIRM